MTNQEVLITNFSGPMQDAVVAMGREQTSLVLEARTENYDSLEQREIPALAK